MTTKRKKYLPLDCTGQRIKRGDVVRIIGVPELDVQPDPFLETERVFRYLVGRYKRIEDFDKLGHAELSFRIPGEPRHSSHTVWIEPYLLRLRRKRST